MFRIDAIWEDGEHIREYLTSRHILEQYKKARSLLIEGYPQKFDFKLRKPKDEGIYQFRINQKYRAFGYFRDDASQRTFIVTKISDHQDF